MNDDKILIAAGKLKERFVPQVQREVPVWAFVTAILDWQVRLDGDLTEESLEAPEFRSYLAEHFRRICEADMFTGSCPFSFEKFSAMTSYIVSQGHDISRTKLNKLLFYCDFINFYLHGKSISGSRYMHMPYGPVPEYYRETIETLSMEKKVQIKKVRGHEELMGEAGGALDLLSLFEVATIKWVLDNFDGMNAHKITSQSHNEKAFLFTRLGEFIPYEFARHFKLLPDPLPPDLLQAQDGH